MNSGFENLCRIAGATKSNFAISGQFLEAFERMNESDDSLWHYLGAGTIVKLVCPKHQFAGIVSQIKQSDAVARFIRFEFAGEDSIENNGLKTSPSDITIAFRENDDPKNEGISFEADYSFSWNAEDGAQRPKSKDDSDDEKPTEVEPEKAPDPFDPIKKFCDQFEI